MSYFDNLKLILALFLPLFVGIGFYKLKFVEEKFPKELSSLLFNITLPCTILVSMQFDATVSEIVEASPLHIICIISIVLAYFLAKPVAKLIEKDEKNHSLITYSLMFSNFTYSAYPILEGFYGKEAIFYASLFNVFTFIFNFTAGILVMQKSGENSQKGLSVKNLVSPPFIALILGVILLIFKIQLPSVINNTVTSISNITTPLSMIMIGMIVARENSFNLRDVRTYIVSFVRLLVIPIITLFVLKALGFTDYMLYVPVIIAANPVAVNLVLFSENYGGRSDIGANYVIISSILSIFTIPFIQMLI